MISGLSTGLDLRARCEEALSRGVDFLEGAQDASGLWSDFPTNRSGESTAWVTGFVLTHCRDISDSAKARAVIALYRERPDSCGWGFSKNTPPDADSTLHVILGLVSSGEDPASLATDFDFIRSHQLSDGGFATYKESQVLSDYRRHDSIRDYSGWLQSHNCVSAAVLLGAAIVPQLLNAAALNALTAFILDRQRPEGSWPAYWWRTMAFTTSHSIQALTLLPAQDGCQAAAAGLRWFNESRLQMGAWSNGYDHASCSLSTALAVQALALAGPDPPHFVSAVEYLLGEQLPDGSWRSSKVLRIPPPHIVDADLFAQWREAGLGVGSISSGSRRVYVTAAVLRALRLATQRLA